MLSISSRNLNKISETFYIQIQSKEKAPQTAEERKKPRKHDPGQPAEVASKKNTAKTKKDTRKWCEFHKSPTHNTSECQAKKSLVANLKAS